MPNIFPQSMLWSIEPSRFQSLLASLRAAGPAAFQAPAAQRSAVPRRASVAGVEIVSVSGVLDKEPSFFLDFFGGTSYMEISTQVAAAVADPEIKTILLVINSPGGSVEGLSDIGDQLFAARESKTIVAQVNGMAASAAYYLAAQADKINAGRMDMIGSIGTLLPMEDLSKLYAAMGVEMLTFATGKFKGAGWPGTEITPEQRDYFQGITNAYFADFLAAVKRGRGQSMKEVADGRMFLASEAKANGLIDRIQTLDQTLAGLTKTQGTPRRARASLDILLCEEGNESAPSRADGETSRNSNSKDKEK
jgi:capsid assembly protease